MTSNDSPSRARTVRTLDPIVFNLYDDDNAPALYIDDGSLRRDLHLELHNQSGHDVEFVPLGATASSDNHHLELRFRPGILSQRALKALTSPDASARVLPASAQAWDLRASSGDAASPVSLFLLFRGAERQFANDHRITLSLREMTAAAGQGSRPTQVQLKLRGVRFREADTPITTTRHRHLNVFYWGRPDVPLRAGFIDSNVLVNDGTFENAVVLRVTNTSKGKTIGAAGAGPTKPTLTLSFDVGEESAWWALGPSDGVGTVSVQVQWPNHALQPIKGAADAPEPDEVAEETHGLGIGPHWKFEFPAEGLKPGDHVDIHIAKLQTKQSGPTNVYVAYRDLPGFRNGQLVCAIQRFPLNEKLATEQRSTLSAHGVTIGQHEQQVTSHATRLAAAEESLKSLDSQIAKLLQDVLMLKTEAPWSPTPIEFPKPACAYGPLLTLQPAPYFVASTAGPIEKATLRVKLGGWLEIPNLKRALEAGPGGAMVLRIPQPALEQNEQILTGVVLPEPFSNNYRGKLEAKFSLRKTGTLHITSVTPSPGEYAEQKWMVWLPGLNAPMYD